MITLDGFFEGPDRELDWHNVNAEFNEYALDMLNSAGALLFGRITYELMAGYWPSPAAGKNDQLIAAKMNTLPKVVFSRRLKKAGWNNTSLMIDGLENEVMRLKAQPGDNLLLLGSGSIVSQLAGLNLIDEYRLMVNPIVLGRGVTLFSGARERLRLKLIRTSIFRSGNVLLCYEPVHMVN